MGKLLSDPRTGALTTALACFGIVLFSSGIFSDGDTYWHIAAGRWMLDNHAVLRIDPFSYTFAGKPWQTHEWLAEIAIALTYVGLGWTGVALLFASVFALTAGLLAWHLSRRLGGITLLTTIILSLALIAAGLLTRPHVLALLPMEIWTAGLVAARAQKRSPSWSLLPVMTLWANVHGGFLVGIVLLIPLIVEAAAETSVRDRQVRQWLLFALLAILAAMLTPFGIDSLLFPFKLMGMPELYGIQEWMPTDLRHFQPLILSAGAGLFILLYRGVKVPPLRLCVLLGLLYLALAQARHQLVLAIVAPLLLAEPLAQALDNHPRTGAPRRTTWAVFFASLALLCGIRLFWPIRDLQTPMTPAAALAHVPVALQHTPVLNDYGFGGYLIFRDLKPFIDGRAELYGHDFLALYDKLLKQDDDALQSTLTKYRIRWAILAPDSTLTRAMDRTKGWHRSYADKTAVIFVRNGTP